MDDERSPVHASGIAPLDAATSGMSRRETLILGGLASAVAYVGAIPTAAFAALRSDEPIDVLFVLYPRFTLQDFAGANEVFARLPNVRVHVATPDGGPITSDTNITLADTLRLADVKSCHVLCVPGGSDHKRAMMTDVQVDLRRLAAQSTYVTSICNGSLVLGNAGLLKGKRSACWWGQRNLLRQYGAIPDKARVVTDGNFVSGGGVTAGIDFALTLAAKLRGPIDAQVVQLTMEYAPQPPFKSGSVETAPRAVVEAWKRRFPALAATAGI